MALEQNPEGTWQVTLDAVQGEVHLELPPIANVLLAPDEALHMAEHLALNAGMLVAVQGLAAAGEEEETP